MGIWPSAHGLSSTRAWGYSQARTGYASISASLASVVGHVANRALYLAKQQPPPTPNPYGPSLEDLIFGKLFGSTAVLGNHFASIDRTLAFCHWLIGYAPRFTARS
jgi:hypothetical protein